MKKTAIMVAATMALMAVSPVASAANEDVLSRTFLTLGSVDWKPHSQNPGDQIGGAGWYHPDDRAGLCLFRLFGVGLAVGFYYETGRVTLSDPNVHVAEFSETGIFVNCPPPLADATTPQPQWLGTSAGNVYLSPEVGQSHLLCFKTFDLCNPDPTTAQWILYDCNGYDGTGVSGSKKNDNQVVFGQGNLIGHNVPGVPDVGSTLVWDGCTRDGSGLDGSGADPGVKAYDASPYLNDQLSRQSSLPNVHLDQLNINTPFSTSYVVSCYQIDFVRFPAGTSHTGTSHDYFLVLGADDTDNWAGALTYHGLAPTGPFGKKTVNPSIAGQGLYDLSGQNGCPSDMGVVDKVLCPHPSYGNPCPAGADPFKKSKDNPLVSI